MDCDDGFLCEIWLKQHLRFMGNVKFVSY